MTKWPSGPVTEPEQGVVRRYQALVVWQRAFDLCMDVYRATRAFPRSEMFGLRGQMRRAAVSIPSNIAEGFGRRTTADFLRPLYRAYGSICESQTQLSLSAKLGYLRSDTAAAIQQAVGDAERLTNSLIRSLERKRLKPAARSSTWSLDHWTTRPR